MIRIELKKACKSGMFAAMLVVGCICAVLSWLYIYGSYQDSFLDLELYRQFHKVVNPDIQSHTIYNSWIGAEAFSFGYSVFFFVIPLLSSFPYGWSYLNEKKTGYLNNVIIRSKKKNYYFSKYCAVFISGGVAVAVPLLLNMILISATIPAVMPDIIYPYFAVSQPSMWSELFFTYPVIYSILYMFLDFLYAGLYAVCSYAISFYLRVKSGVVLFPFLCVMFVHFINPRLHSSYELSPVYYLHIPIIRDTSGGVVWGVWLLLMAITVYICVFRGTKHEIL